ncbi:uncharacterized protein LOC101165124 isoform X1 [Xyrichtys novacula]|uniref:Uncharacterized protein LOC101165124 isoform X1 n=1 Tax=Xyrichtys novacula TaxID=13765 RepID=A0AAV1H9S3_XYRNO|nr:uncharacterized protein LOC101165124 isoform X1 [Xyrichtys novacula]
MDQILKGLQGVVSIAGDLAVYGANEEEHDMNLINMMEQAAELGIVFNSEKCTIKHNSISFFGNLYTDRGIRPDLAKIRDIQKMPTPQNKEDLHRFMGMLAYLSPYIPKFVDKAHTLRGLLKNESPGLWDTDHHKCFEDLKITVTEDACLKYFDQNTPLALEVDASQKGLAFPNVIGAIDCTHVRIKRHSGEHQGDYINRKSFHSINVQVRVFCGYSDLHKLLMCIKGP